YRALWANNIPVDVISPAMDWSGYRIVYLPETVCLDRQLIDRISGTIRRSERTCLIADGLFGTNASNGSFSYDPPEGLSGLLGVRTLDYTRLTSDDIRKGSNQLRMAHGSF